VASDLSADAEAWRAARQAVQDAKDHVKETQLALQEARERLNASLVAQAKAGVRMRDLVAQTGLSREWIRTVLRANGILADD
jgi:capsule polysaccharide export protein KpsE/RkpR